MSNLGRWLAALLVLLAVVALLGVFALGERLIQPARRAIGSAPAEWNTSEVALRGADGLNVAGWLARGRDGGGAVLIVHGVRASRLDMLGRALFLHRLGYSVLLIDLPAHGMSGGDHIGYGLTEAAAVQAALGLLARELPREKVGVIAVSLGAAALVLAAPFAAGTEPAAVVLESMFPTIRQALANRLRAHMGPAGRLVEPIMLWFLELRLGVSPDRLAPVEKLPQLHMPLLIASGAADAYTTAAETERIFDAANEPKSLWLAAGAAHVDLQRHDPAGYELRVARFLGTWLRSGAR